MSISYYGFCKLPVAEAQRRIVFLRKQKPEWFDVILLLYDASKPHEPVGREVASGFIANPRSVFTLAVNDKEHFSAILREALEFIYEVFGTGDLVMTHEMELVHPPLRPHLPMKM